MNDFPISDQTEKHDNKNLMMGYDQETSDWSILDLY